MITAVDANILIDIFSPDPIFGPISREKLRQLSQEGALIICEAVYAEVAGWFSQQAQLERFLNETGIGLKPSTPESLWKASQIWRKTRKGRTDEPVLRRRLLADFLIGAHALLQAEQLLTRDKGFYRASFSGLRLVG